jgi:hypothetical protein
MKKLNVLLAVTDSLKGKYKRMVEDFTKFFKSSQGSFLGERATYVPKPDMVDEPGKRKYVRVVTTVDEKINWFITESKEFIDALFSQEKTNASGLAKADLIVEGDNWGNYTSLELLRLKNLLETSDLGKMEEMLSEIPVRSDAEIWAPTTAEEYQGRNIFEGSLLSGVTKTTVKEEYILEDPNVQHLKGSTYTPKVATKNTVVELGDFTSQKFTGQWSHRQRAEALRRRSVLITAVTAALKECNDVVAVQSDLTSDLIFGYIFGK